MSESLGTGEQPAPELPPEPARRDPIKTLLWMFSPAIFMVLSVAFGYRRGEFGIQPDTTLGWGLFWVGLLGCPWIVIARISSVVDRIKTNRFFQALIALGVLGLVLFMNLFIAINGCSSLAKF